MNIQNIQDKFLSLLRNLKFKLETLIPIHYAYYWIFEKGFWRSLYQRFKYGFPYSDTWNLDEKIIEFVLPRLKRFRDEVEQEVNIGLPHKYGSKRFDKCLTTEEWLSILDKMIAAFEIASYDKWNFDEGKVEENIKKYKEGMKLFAQYMMSLWW